MFSHSNEYKVVSSDKGQPSDKSFCNLNRGIPHSEGTSKNFNSKLRLYQTLNK